MRTAVQFCAYFTSFPKRYVRIQLFPDPRQDCRKPGGPNCLLFISDLTTCRIAVRCSSCVRAKGKR